jgi:hypothetical protein
MQGCFTWLLLMALAVFVMMSMLRWFEQTSEAVERGEWNRVIFLVVFPFGVWFYPARVSAGRPTPVPQHEPIRGFGKMPRTVEGAEVAAAGAPVARTPVADAPGLKGLKGITDEPPPGTPKEFLGMPVVPPRPKGDAPAKPRVDPEKLAKLRQKMREQGMLGEEKDDN